MFINKPGKYHVDFGINCHDTGFIGKGIKFVADGCGESKHPEVGAKLAALKFSTHPWLSIPKIMDNVFRSIFAADPEWYMMEIEDSREFIETVRDYMLFTTLLVREDDEKFTVDYTGDGFIITITHDDMISYILLNDSDTNPGFYAYNYIGSDHLTEHKNGVEVKHMEFSKVQFKNIGVASDGLRYITPSSKASQTLKEEFSSLLLAGKDTPVKLFINRNLSIFQDDITIAL
jgi:hypothetical protein